MRDGDIYRWRYKPHVVKARRESDDAGTLYWCCSRIAEFRDGVLRDTYWQTSSGNRTWTPEDAERDLVLTFVANYDALEAAPHDVHAKYDEASIVDLRHPNTSRWLVYIRRGAKPSPDAMRRHLESVIARARQNISYEEHRIEACREQLAKVAAGDFDFYIEPVSNR